jgi:hypothetical protein
VRHMLRIALFGLYTLGGGAALAQSSQIPQEMLDLDNQRCVSDCVPAYGETTCKPLCSCMIGEYKKRLDFDTYLTLSVQLAKNEISPENRVLLDGIAKVCTAQIDAAGIDVGSDMGKEPTEPQQP